MNNLIKYSVNSISDFSNKIENSALAINDTIDHMINMTNEMDMFFNTPTGKVVKETMINILKKFKTENEGLTDFSKLIKDINIVYKNNIEAISDSIGGNK